MTRTTSNRSDRAVALVTGASSGIGRAIAEALTHEGYVVIGTSRNAATAPPLAGVDFVDLDVTSEDSVGDAVTGVIERFGRIDVLVNNAGIGLAGAAEESTAEQARTLFDVNLFGVMRMTNAVLPHMRARRAGRIVNISSILGLIPAPYMAIYASTKHAVEGYSESLDHELRQHGVRVLLIEPGYTGTAFEANTLNPDSPLAVYAHQRTVSRDVLVAAMRTADDPTVVAAAAVRAITRANPRPRRAAGSLSRRVSLLRRLVPSVAFDKQIRKLNRLPA